MNTIGLWMDRKVLGTTLGIRKYPLTWCFVFARVRLVPETNASGRVNQGLSNVTSG